ncbi:SprT family zinc-dependent metalloprotease [Psychrobacter sp. A3]|uniref:M48 family metallopeptidase n=1 Tax=Psychrobacter sp. A3 TaxID=2992754 RepID=UPI00237A84FE|nr:SprT family zinc-dependent metalloprotease [Psychrobacter sp. A3]MDE0490027.1 SprT family zinc-dependent metalloprotease [Psychrobacter sp. A3]
MANRPKHKTVSNNGVAATRVSNHSAPSNSTLTRSNDTQHHLYYGQDKISYDVIRKDKARKLRIKVYPDQRVVVSVPMQVTDEFIYQSVKKRVRWIWQHLQDFAKQKTDVLPKRYVSGEPQFYLGRRYVLKVLVDPEQATNVKLIRGKLTVSLTHDSRDRAAKVKALLDAWYQTKARIVFAERLAAVLPQADWVHSSPTFKILSMKKQWGSCSAQGNLVLNPHLVKAPKECIDYVILHELCHIKEHNHSERFWRLLSQVMPHWKAVKTELDSMAELYLNE